MDDVFGVLSDAQSCKETIVILKSKALKSLMEKDGMDYEEALEFYDFNIEGAKGKGQYSCVDDTLTSEQIEELEL